MLVVDEPSSIGRVCELPTVVKPTIDEVPIVIDAITLIASLLLNLATQLNGPRKRALHVGPLRPS